jgi:16S rRNA (uracil1498-N3)-methyltransferase
MRRFFAEPKCFSEREVVLSREESKHLRDVLRLREGERISVFDGAGNEFLCLIKKIEREKSMLEILEKINAPAPESDLNLTLAIALLKGEKFDLVVQKATELGAKRIVPLGTKRADVKLKDESDATKKMERWRRIALEAAKQSGRSVVPVIEMPILFENFVKNETGILFAERGGANLHQSLEMFDRNLTAIVGAEGGWETAEIDSARENNFQIVTLGGRILRAETAAITVVSLLQHLRGDLR